MLLATDVGYTPVGELTQARAAAVRFDAWDSPTPVDAWVSSIENAAPYVPGEFYRRELPCLWPLVQEAARRGPLDVVIVDGFVDLGPRGDGLGRHLWRRLRAEAMTAEVVGVAKRPFKDAVAVPALRGESEVPLWVSTTGPSLDEAAAAVRRMHGPYRLPTLLKRVDQIANGAPPSE